MLYRDILIIFKQGNSNARELAEKVRGWLASSDAVPSVVEATHGRDFPRGKFDCVIILGGDGTILGIARKLAGKAIPVFGINLGNVGFLTACGIHNWREKLNLALNGTSSPRKCLALKWMHLRNGKCLDEGYAINEVVAGRGALARLISLSVHVNGHVMGILRSDGIIVSTPPGSSGYCASAGGPLVYPDMNCVCLTAICPFPSGLSPLVLPGETNFEIKMISNDGHITIDGQDGLHLQKCDVVRLAGVPDAIHIWGDDNSYYEKLQKRGFSLPGCEESY